ncbi:SGNH/GDSL hydrolase family protein [Acetobacterium sp.]|uniref:SGNH/GDSL hydrolase family protein n=1 Tax=Acetobacterium sp. TaxID=1872094 RepID=UPI002F3F4DD2
MANIIQNVANIRAASAGKAVRETIAAGIEAINEEVVSTTGKQTALEDQFVQVIQGATDDNPSPIEIETARGGFPILNDRLNSVDADLAEKASIVALAAVASGGPKAVTLVAQMTDILKTYVYTGAQGGYSNGHWYWWNGTAWTNGGVYQSTGITNGSVNREAVNFYKVNTDNFIDVNNLDVGYYHYTTGAHVNNALYLTTKLIPVIPGDQFIKSGIGMVTYWDASEEFVSGVNTSDPNIFLIPEGISYVKVALDLAAKYTYILAKGTLLPNFEDEQLIVRENNLDKDIIFKAANMDFLIQSSLNLFDKSLATYGYFNYITGAYVTTFDFMSTPYIPVIVDYIYSISGIAHVTFWGVNNVFISGVYDSTFTIPDGTLTVRFGLYPENIDTDMMVLGEVYPTVYIPYDEYEIDVTKVKTSITVNSPLDSMVLAGIGDSMTYGNDYLINLTALLNLDSAINYGENGTTIASNLACYGGASRAMCLRYGEMTNTTDLVTVLGGTNDYGFNTPLGTLGDVVNTTFYGALKILIEGLYTKYPTQRIFFFTPLQRDWEEDDFVWGGVNDIGLTLKQYVDVIKEMCAVYSIPALDLYSTSGITGANLSSYTSDGLHLVAIGNTRIAKQMSSFMEQN